VDYRGRGWIAEVTSDGGNIVGAKYGCSIGLRDLFSNEMAKDRELVADILVDADNFLPDVRGQIVSADEAVVVVGGGEDTSIFTTGGQQRLSVRV
jgi:hypothetical protein